MTQSLIILDNQGDELWVERLRRINGDRRSAPFSGEFDRIDSVIVDLQSPIDRSDFPHRSDMLGWRRWYGNHHIDSVELYQPGAGTLAAAAAAAVLRLDLNIHLTGQVDSRLLTRLKVLARHVTAFHCAGRFIADRLRAAGFDRRKIALESAQIEMPPIKNPTRLEDVLIGVDCDKSQPFGRLLLLALPAPGNHRALGTVVQTAGLLAHTLPGVTLIVTGRCNDADRACLECWQRVWHCPGLVHIDQALTQWRQLLSVCTVVLGSAGPLDEVLRLLYARAAGAIVVAGGQCAEFLADNPHGRLVQPCGPSRLAAAVLKTTQTTATT